MIWPLALLGLFSLHSASANDRVLNFSSPCKVFRLEDKSWKPIDATPFHAFVLSESQIIKDEAFTVFKTEAGTYGIDEKCVKDVTRPVIRRSDWAAAFSLGMNLSPKGTVVSTVAGTSTTATTPFKSSVAFTGGASYRALSHLRLSAEIGLSQLTESSSKGNETSYFDLSPELVFRIQKRTEFHLGPNFGLFFFSQNAQTDTVYSISQQSATSLLIGLNAGIDYELTNQFALGILFHYFKPGALKVTGTRLADSEPTEVALSVNYLMLGTRFTIHF